MPEESLRKGTPPPSGRTPKTAPPPADAPDVVASTAPDDDLSDYVVPPDLEPVPDDVAPLGTGTTAGRSVSAYPAPPAPSAGPVTTADTELVFRLQRELAEAQERLSRRESDVSTWSAGPAPVAPRPGEKVLIHVRQDGFTANGQVWYLGQELEFTVGEANWKATCDRQGNSWLTLDDAGQIRRWGRVMFGFGPWPGQPFADVRAAAAESRRGRVAPSIPQLSPAVKQMRS